MPTKAQLKKQHYHAQRAIDAIGQKALAIDLKVSPGYVSNIYNGRRVMPATHCLRVECLCDYLVTRYDLRPDVFGEAPA